MLYKWILISFYIHIFVSNAATLNLWLWPIWLTILQAVKDTTSPANMAVPCLVWLADWQFNHKKGWPGSLLSASSTERNLSHKHSHGTIYRKLYFPIQQIRGHKPNVAMGIWVFSLSSPLEFPSISLFLYWWGDDRQHTRWLIRLIRRLNLKLQNVHIVSFSDVWVLLLFWND